MSEDLSNFIGNDRDEQDETGPKLKLYTAGSGNGDWAYVVEGANTDKRRRDSYEGDTKNGFNPQLKAVAEGTEHIVNDFTKSELTIYTPSDSIVGLMEGESNPDSGYRELCRTAKKNYDDNWGRWEIEHLPKEEDNPARDLI